MKTRLFPSLWLLILIASPAFGDEPRSLYEEVISSSHNMIPKGETPTSPHQVCLTCHTLDEVQNYLEPAVQTPPELAAIFEPVPQKRPENSRILWSASNHQVSYSPARSGILKNEPSAACLACHDGAIGADIYGMKQNHGKFQDHPVDILYPRESNGHYVPALPLPTELRYWSIPDQNGHGITLPTGPTSDYYSKQTLPAMAVRTSYGKINCGSCHNPHSSKISAYLRESPKTLCLVCHIR
ncbi:MAG: cytochrome c3 family protein [Nitrospirae bacterium]|nr:cytochrome c3 family protein [Nitrospirota bacterium]MBI3593653.1 cytochrome c3 family protein [Nitrospirota bacterium]